MALLGEKNVAKRPEVREKIRKALLGNKNAKSINNRTKFQKGHENNLGKHWKCQKKHRQRIGKEGNNWKGGKTKLQLRIRELKKYDIWRIKVFERDNWTCQYCRQRGCKMNAHHIEKFSKILDKYNIQMIEQAIECSELWNINNGVTLCEECHNLTK